MALFFIALMILYMQCAVMQGQILKNALMIADILMVAYRT